MSTVMERKPSVVMRVTQWLIRAYPICPQCDVRMNRDDSGKNDKMLGYFQCPTCGWRTKSRDRME